MTERLTCKKDCYYWNEYDQDCECLGENHPCPRKCYIFKEKYPEKLNNKKRKIQCVDIPNGFYYVKSGLSNNVEIRYLGNSFFEGNIEVVTLVPSYSEYQALKDNCDFTHTRLKGTHQKITQLEKKLAIAVSVLKRYEMTDEFEGGVGSEYEDMMLDCTKALKQIKEAK